METTTKITKMILDKSLIDNKTSHKTELFIISLKSLLPSEREVKIYIDYERYKKEFLLWKSYKESTNRVLENIKNNIDKDIYLNEEDDSIIYRILPLVLTNSNYISLQEEVVKNILYTTGNIEDLIENLLISKLVYLLLNNRNNIVELLKEELINLNQIEFKANFKKYFRILPEENKSFSIKFEKTKIDGLNILNDIGSMKLKNFEKIYRIYRDKEESNKIEILEEVIKNLDGKPYEETNISYFEELGKYLYNMKKSRINPTSLRIEEYKMPDIFKYKKGEWFYHSLLNNCQVVDKICDENHIYVKIRTKSGIYNFKKPII